MTERASGINNYSSERGGLYIHVAYCRKKCIYCDFFSAGVRIADWHRYVDALCSEFNARVSEMAYQIRTLYIGGGTPSLMPSEEFIRLCEFLKPYMSELKEFSLEVNPDDVTLEKLRVWRGGGVNRLSLGIQSFDDNLLGAIGRHHDASTAMHAYRLAREYFDNISIDLMFGLPGQTIENWEKDVDVAIRMRPEHISAYSLMYEPSTALTALRDNGIVAESSEEISEKMFRILIEKLKGSGYDHYEISNFAKPGYRSRHNSSYWHQTPYLGLGPSAHSYDGRRTRKANRADLRGYIEYWIKDESKIGQKNKGTFYETEILSDEELMEEFVMTRMRTREGISIEDFTRKFGKLAAKLLTTKAKLLKDQGLILMDSKSISLSESAILISDSIIVELM